MRAPTFRSAGPARLLSTIRGQSDAIARCGANQYTGRRDATGGIHPSERAEARRRRAHRAPEPPAPAQAEDGAHVANPRNDDSHCLRVLRLDAAVRRRVRTLRPWRLTDAKE